MNPAKNEVTLKSKAAAGQDFTIWDLVFYRGFS